MPRLRADHLASLVRSFCQLVQVIQELRGIPKPGQLRPDLDPAQAMKALKRIRERLPVDIGQGSKASIADGPTADPTTAAAGQPARSPRRPPKAKAPCETATSSLTSHPGNPLTKPPIEEAIDHPSELDLPDTDDDANA